MGSLMSIIQTIIAKLFGGNSAAFMKVVTQMLANKSGGGLAAIIAGFQNKGMGKLADSWVGAGPNEKPTPDQIKEGLGQERVQELINQTGMKEEELLNKLAALLPKAVDRMTPEGKLPAGSPG